ncbi:MULTISPECIES: YdeI/OmpD-associated family protein [unclassified Brevundimonas]|uniref:YdeI/OmpD-associated family protein n=1 Tax=unclassified Brevundimonas TaxID=2622653 RepID=UPI0025C604D0|nr:MULTISPECIES: YdeI/OmpD-associated family protein [unclassified Brevundimonas]
MNATSEPIAQGVVHAVAPDLETAIRADGQAFALWQGLTPLGRNEFICWVEDAKQVATRQKRIERTLEALKEGKRRPCCWAGCVHRTDKAPGPWQQMRLDQSRS